MQSQKTQVYEWFARNGRVDVPEEHWERLPSRAWMCTLMHIDFLPVDAVGSTKKIVKELVYEQFSEYLPTYTQLDSQIVQVKMDYLQPFTTMSFSGNETGDGWVGSVVVGENEFIEYEIRLTGFSGSPMNMATILRNKLKWLVACKCFNIPTLYDLDDSSSEESLIFDEEAARAAQAEVQAMLEADVVAEQNEEFGIPNAGDISDEDLVQLYKFTWRVHREHKQKGEDVSDLEQHLDDLRRMASDKMKDYKLEIQGLMDQRDLHSDSDPAILFVDNKIMTAVYNRMKLGNIFKEELGTPNSSKETCPPIYCGPGTPGFPKGFPPQPYQPLVNPVLGPSGVTGSHWYHASVIRNAATLDTKANILSKVKQAVNAFPLSRHHFVRLSTSAFTPLFPPIEHGEDTAIQFASNDTCYDASATLPAGVNRLCMIDARYIPRGGTAVVPSAFYNIIRDCLVLLNTNFGPIPETLRLTVTVEQTSIIIIHDYPFLKSEVDAALELDEEGIPNSAPPSAMNMDQGSKSMTPVIPNIPADGGNTSGTPPAHADQPASSTMAPSINAPSDPQVRATRDMPAQMPLMSMVGGPPNMASMNMYQDDLISLVYREFDLTTITVQGGQAKGTIVASFPYGLNLLNPYAQTWARLHKRYNGRIRVTVSISAVPMLKGNILIGVVRNMPPTGTTTFSTVTLQKINWAILNLNGSGDYQIDIGDARQTEFFRNTSEDPPNADPADLTSRPGIIAVVYTPITNQFGGDADNTAVMNFRSQAISPLEDSVTGFYTYEPLDFTELVSTTPIRSVPQYQFLSDIIPSTANRSLFLDGTKFINNDIQNLHMQAYDPIRISEYRFPERTAGFTQPFAYVPHNGTVAAEFLFSVVTIPPPYLTWSEESKSYNSTDLASLQQLITHGTTNNLLEGSSGAKFLGYYTNTASTSLNDVVVFYGDDVNVQWSSLTTFQIVYIVYDVGLIVLYHCKADVNEDLNVLGFGRNPDRNVTLPYYEQTVRNIVGGFPSSDFTLPTGYYNVVCATDGQVAMLNPIDGLPVLLPDLSFTQTIFKQKANFPLDSSKSQFAIDLVDFRDGSLIGTLCTYGSQVVLRTEVPNPGRSHYRINIDLRFLALTNPRSILTVPLSVSSPWLDLFEPPTFSPATLIVNKLRNHKSNDPRVSEMASLLEGLFGAEFGTPNSSYGSMGFTLPERGADTRNFFLSSKGKKRLRFQSNPRMRIFNEYQYSEIPGDDEHFQNLPALYQQHVPDYKFNSSEETVSPMSHAVHSAEKLGGSSLEKSLLGDSLSTFGLFSGLAGGIGSVASEIVGDIGEGLLAKQRFGYENQLQNSKYKLEGNLSAQNFHQKLQEMQFNTQQDLVKRGIINSSIGRGSATIGM